MRFGLKEAALRRSYLDRGGVEDLADLEDFSGIFVEPPAWRIVPVLGRRVSSRYRYVGGAARARSLVSFLHVRNPKRNHVLSF